MSEGKKVPKIRFPGFEGEWELYIIADLFDKITEKNRKQMVSNVITNSAEYGLIPQEEYFDKEIAVEGSTDNYTIIQKGDFVYNPRKSSFAPMGPFNCYTREEKGIVSPLYSCLRPRGIIDPGFLLWYFKTDKWYAYVKDNGAQNGARHDRVGMTDKILMGIPVIVPCNEEQRKVSSFLTEIERIISIQEQELDHLKNLKKGLLRKMFPKEGESVPEIRFPGFKGEWKHRKLHDIVDKAVDNRGKTPLVSEHGKHPLIEVASLGGSAPDYSKVTKYLDEETFLTALRGYIREGDILFATVGSIGIVSYMDNHEDAAIAQNIVSFRAKYRNDSKFIYAMFSFEENKQIAQRIAMGAVQPSIKVSQLLEEEYCVPNDIQEQKLIGHLFYSIDNVIQQYQCELNKWKELKKGLLQQMFVA